MYSWYKKLPPHVSHMSHKETKRHQRMTLLYKQGDKALKNTPTNIPLVKKLMQMQLPKFIHRAANDYGYWGSNQELIYN